MELTALVLPVSTSGSSLISFAGGISSSKLVNMLNPDLVCQHGSGSTGGTEPAACKADSLADSNRSTRSISAWSAGTATDRSDGAHGPGIASLNEWQQSDQFLLEVSLVASWSTCSISIWLSARLRLNWRTEPAERKDDSPAGSNWSTRSISAWSAGTATARSDGAHGPGIASLDEWQQSDQLCWSYL